MGKAARWPSALWRNKSFRPEGGPVTHHSIYYSLAFLPKPYLWEDFVLEEEPGQ